jgi:hypothetical protein|tara:strand:- start:364 stop:579 length:216 start_codon:yes stop_codon:yes gene_type:complete
MKYLLVMFMCSGIAGNECKQIVPEFTQFKDHKACSIYGYYQSHKLISEFDTDFVNNYKTYIVFNCSETSST